MDSVEFGPEALVDSRVAHHCGFDIDVVDSMLGKAIPRYRDEYMGQDNRRRSCNRSRGRYNRDGHWERERDYRHQSRSHDGSPDYHKDHGRGRYDDERRSRSRSYGSASPARCSPSPRRNPSPRKTPPSRGGSPDERNRKVHSPTPKSVSPHGRATDSRSPSPRSNADVTTSFLRLIASRSLWSNWFLGILFVGMR
ncbi:hypothetical protein CsSME_00035418 [Camellia sinensis var. sinensis]